MKKIFIIINLILITITLSAQTGDGSSGNPFYGTISSSITWSVGDPNYGSTVYIGTSSNNDLTVGTGGHLTIDPGITVIFTQLTSDLFVTETGQITAGGTGSQVTFTKDPGKSHWGHISFENMKNAGASLIDNCIIEWGDVSGSSLPNRYGGGIHTSFTNLTISNSIIRNNKAGWGGGIFVNKDASPLISNCLIQDNSSVQSGGGVYIWSRSASVVTNCIIFNNSSTEGGGGGGIFLGDLCGDVRIYNSTIVNNSAAASGNNIHLYVNTNPARPSFINCIIWNPANSIAYSTQTPASSDFVNCAIQDPVSGSTTNSLSLNSSNTDPAGPNFTNPSGNDYSIVFVSPCRDAGTSSGAPATDYLGNNRIYNYDIGAYEVQYSRWKTNASAKTDWTSTGNWEQGLYPGLTGTTGDVIVPYLADDTNAPNISGTTTIASGKYLILEAGAKATLSTISNSGTLRLMAGDDPFSLIVNSYSNNSGAGTEKIELYLTGKELSEINKWHYISPPVSSLGTGTFTSHTNNLAQFVESLPSGNAYQGWIAYDGYNYSTGAIPDPAVFTFSSLTAGQGYNYFHTLNLKYTFSGDLNTTDVSKSLAYTGAPDNPLRGFNLLGNPFSSGLDWDVIANGTYPSNTSKAIHFTQNDADCYYVGGIGTNGATGIIPPMQGFFVKANNTPDILLTFPAATARVHNSIHARYKGASGTIPLVKLSLSENGISDETIVRFDELAKAGYDYDFDAVKMFFSTEKTSIYSSVTGTNYAINGQPFPDIFVEIPVAINLLASGNHNISAIQLQGLDDYNVTLTDKTTGFSTDLKTTPNLAFSASAGLINDRFILKISNATTGIENPSISKNIFNIYSSNDFINIQTIADEWDGQQGSVTVLDLSGKKVSDLSNTEFSKNSITQVAAPSSKGMYFVELRSGLKRYVEKVVIR